MALQKDVKAVSQRNYDIWYDYVVLGLPGALIADKHNLSVPRVSQIVNRVRHLIPDPVREDVTKDVLEQLAAVRRGLMPEALNGDPKSIMALSKLWDRQAKILGLDAPTRVDAVAAIKYEVVGVSDEDLG